MVKTKLFLWIVFVFLIILRSEAQDAQPAKFGKISPQDFQNISLKFDTGANAVILADIGKTSFEGNGKGFFSLVHTHFIRVKILNKNGFGAADFEELLYNDRSGVNEKMIVLKGSTYNLQNGVIQETKLDEKSVFTERHSQHYDHVKFSMPSLSVGSIFDVMYTTKSSYFANPTAWEFQKDYPCLWSEYEVTIPSFFHYYVKTGGDGVFDVKTNKQIQQSFSVRKDAGVSAGDYFMIDCTSIQSRWVKKNVPAVKKQPFLSTINNYIPKISFELNYFLQGPEYDKQFELGTWITKSHELLASPEFGFELDQENNWMDSQIKALTKNAGTPENKIRAIFCFIRDNFRCTDNSDMYIGTSLKNVFS